MENENNDKEKISFFKKLKYSIYDTKNSDKILEEKNNSHRKFMFIILIVLAMILGFVLYFSSMKSPEVNVLNNEITLEKLKNAESGFSYDNDQRKQIDISENKTSVVLDTRQIEFDKIVEENEKRIKEDSNLEKITLLTKDNIVVFLKNTKPMVYSFETEESREALMKVIELSKNGILMYIIISFASLIQLYIIYLIIFKTIGKLTVSIFSGLTKYNITKEETDKIATYSATAPNILFALATILSKKITSLNLGVTVMILIIIYSIYVILMMTELKQKGNVKKHG